MHGAFQICLIIDFRLFTNKKSNCLCTSGGSDIIFIARRITHHLRTRQSNNIMYFDCLLIWTLNAVAIIPTV